VSAEPTGAQAGEGLQRLAQDLVGGFRTAEDVATTFLRQAIVRGVLAPGEKVNQDEVADALGVSRIPIRAALRHLEAERLVEVHAYRGVSVRKLTPREIAEIFELRLTLESAALEWAHANMSRRDLADVRTAARELDDRSGDPMPWVYARRSFYFLLYGYADRPLLLQLIDQLRTELGPHLAIHGATEQHAAHEELLDLLEADDVAQAKAWLCDHLREIGRRVLRSVGESRPLLG
jgi:DNA-binding GntR family transcriptional regulator